MTSTGHAGREPPAAPLRNESSDSPKECGSTILSSREQQRLFRSVFEQSIYSLVVTDVEGVLLCTNPAFDQMLGYPPGALCGRNFAELTHPGDLPANLELFERLLSGEIESYQMEKRYLHQDGHDVPVALTVTLVRGDPDTPTYLLAIIEDTAHRKAQDDRIHHLTHTDSLTGLPNRTSFMTTLRETIGVAHWGSRWFAVALVDLDRFKAVNESFGHALGDAVLREIGQRLARAFPPPSSVARLGDDEFGVLVDGGSDRHHAEDAARDLVQAALSTVQRPFALEGAEVTVTASMGVALYPADAGSAEDLARHLEAATAHAKRRPGHAFSFGSVGLVSDAEQRLRVENDLRRALERNELRIHYQPQVDLQRGVPVGVEALVRWPNGARGPLSPGRFLPVAEHTGLIVELDRWVLGEVLGHQQAWRAEGHPPLRMAVNLSAVTFRDAEPDALLAEALARTGADPSQVEIEITETTLMESSGRSAAIIERLRNLGTSLALDDFGTGYSSLAYLQRYPFDRLKIDRSFMAGIDRQPPQTGLLGAIVDLGHALGLQVVAEGLETESQLAFLRGAGCEEAQGYLLACPQDVEALRSTLAGWQAIPTPGLL